MFRTKSNFRINASSDCDTASFEVPNFNASSGLLPGDGTVFIVMRRYFGRNAQDIFAT